MSQVCSKLGLAGAKVRDRETGLWWGVARVHDGGTTNYDGVELVRPGGQERRVSSHITNKWPVVYPPGHPSHDPDEWAKAPW